MQQDIIFSCVENQMRLWKFCEILILFLAQNIIKLLHKKFSFENKFLQISNITQFYKSSSDTNVVNIHLILF